MARYIAAVVLAGIVSVVLCGFIVHDFGTNHTAHANHETSFVEHHFSMWSDFATAVVADVTASLSLLLIIAASLYVTARIISQLLSNLLFTYAYERIPIQSTHGHERAPHLRRWLTRFEHSPSHS